MSDVTLSTHILDLETGQPAGGLEVALIDGAGQEIHTAATDADGRIGTFPAIEQGTYTLRFDVHPWFAAQSRDCFYPSVTVTFLVGGDRPHYHVPLLLNRYGYSTYRGS